MLTIQTTDCRAKEAESLEQAKRSDDEDLRHLYETIAKQWHLLAERTDKHQSDTVGPAECVDAPIGVSKINTFPETTNSPSAESSSAPTFDADSCIARVSSDIYDDRTEPGGADAFEIRLRDDQIVEIEGDVTQVSGNLKGNETLEPQISDMDDRALQADTAVGVFESREDQILETAYNDAQLSTDSKGIEDMDDQISESAHRTSTSITDERRFKILDDHIPETGCSADQVIAASKSIEGKDDQISEPGHSTMPASAVAGSIENVDVQVANTTQRAEQSRPRSRRIERPLGILSSLIKGSSDYRV